MRERLRGLEERIAHLYRSWAQRVATHEDLHALWTDLACHGEKRASMLTAAQDEVLAAHKEAPTVGAGEALATLEACLAAAESVAAKARVDARLMAALDFEVNDLGVRRQVGLVYGEQDERLGLAIAVRLATMVSLYSDEVHLFVEAAELIAGARRASRRHHGVP
jgi:hypothetical protein